MKKIYLVTIPAHYWIVKASLIRAWDSGMEFQKDQSISKKNKSIIYQDIGVLSLRSTTNTAHENYSTENIRYQEWHTRSMNNLSLLSLQEQASLKIKNEAKQKQNLKKTNRQTLGKKKKKSQAPGAPFKQLINLGLNFQKFWSSNCMTIVKTCRYLYFILYLTQLDIESTFFFFDVKMINLFKNENYLHSYTFTGQLTQTTMQEYFI